MSGRDSMEEVTITIPLVPPSLNVFYSGRHWAIRKALADEWHNAVWVICKKQKIKKITEFPVDIITQTYYKSKRERDTDNTILAPKLICDGLKLAGIIPDDNPKYIGTHIIKPPIIGYKEDMTVVKICY